MARMPDAHWLGEHSPGRLMDRYDIVCVHTIVGYAPAHQAHFSTKADGTILQSRDTKFRSGANLDGNHRVIAIENEDHGPAFGTWNTNDGHAVPAFTAAQIEANAKILAWAHKTHGVPLQLCPNSKSTSRGLAYHRQGIDGNFSDYDYPGRVAGGEIWTKSFGKVCPGDRRISARDQILARARQIASGDDDMTPEQAAQLTAVTNAVARLEDDGPGSIEAAVWNQGRGPAVRTQVNTIEAGVTTLLAQTGVDVDEAALAANLAPLLIPHLPTVVVDLDDAALAEIAVAVADEQARRLQA